MGPLPLIAAKHQSAGPENVLPQWQQKIADAKIMMVDIMTGFGSAYFLHEVRFFAGIGPAHFPAETTRPLGPRLSAFSPSL